MIILPVYLLLDSFLLIVVNMIMAMLAALKNMIFMLKENLSPWFGSWEQRPCFDNGIALWDLL